MDCLQSDKLLQQAYEIIEKARNEEDEAKDNLPESFYDKADEMESCVNNLDEALENIESAQISISEYLPEDKAAKEMEEFLELEKEAQKMLSLLKRNKDFNNNEVQTKETEYQKH